MSFSKQDEAKGFHNPTFIEPIEEEKPQTQDTEKVEEPLEKEEEPKEVCYVLRHTCV